MKHTKPRTRMMARIAALRRRRKVVEFMAGLSTDTGGAYTWLMTKAPSGQPWEQENWLDSARSEKAPDGNPGH